MTKRKTEPQAPALRDSDVMFLAIKRLEAVADKMQRREYDATLDRLLAEAAEFFEWVTFSMNQRRQDGDE